MPLAAEPETALSEERAALERFRFENPGLFKKNDAALFDHLLTVALFLAAGTTLAMWIQPWPLKILLGAVNAFFWFSLINVTIHHHHTHHNAALSGEMKKTLNFIYHLVLPSAPKRINRYTRAHLNHHARPFHETDVDHHYGTSRWLAVRAKGPLAILLYFLELTFIGAHVPGWEDDRYMNSVPLEEWNHESYLVMKKSERRLAVRMALIQWAGFFLMLKFIPALAWGWAFPMLLVKNWAHFLGQFQHYDERLLDPASSESKRTRTYRFPSFLNYLCGGEIAGQIKEITSNVNAHLKRNDEAIDRIILNLDTSMTNIKSITTNLDERLTLNKDHIDQMMVHLDSSARNLDEFTLDLKSNPWKLLYRPPLTKKNILKNLQK